ncbi:MAG: hypothetical protein JXR77_05680 [Lentisphaeria bacterium]|nr:hypothetical protein [Lentisphaeria bacterium]
MAEAEEDGDQPDQTPEGVDGQGGQEQRASHLGNQQQEGTAKEGEGVGGGPQGAARGASEPAWRRPVGEGLLEEAAAETDPGDMAEFVGQQLAAVVDQPALAPFKGLADDE